MAHTILREDGVGLRSIKGSEMLFCGNDILTSATARYDEERRLCFVSSLPQKVSHPPDPGPSASPIYNINFVVRDWRLNPFYLLYTIIYVLPAISCDGQRPCSRCVQLKKDCLDVPLKKVGRPKKNPVPQEAQRRLDEACFTSVQGNQQFDTIPWAN